MQIDNEPIVNINTHESPELPGDSSLGVPIAGSQVSEASGSHVSWTWVAMATIDSGFNPAAMVRTTASQETVEKYAEILDTLPPVELIYDAKARKHWVGDGRHRLEASRAKGLSQVKAKVVTGNKIDAFTIACHANDTHGLPASQADKRHRVETALRHPEMKDKTQTEIAKICGVSQSFVGNIKRKSESVYSTGAINGVESDVAGFKPRLKPGRKPRPKAQAEQHVDFATPTPTSDHGEEDFVATPRVGVRGPKIPSVEPPDPAPAPFRMVSLLESLTGNATLPPGCRSFEKFCKDEDQREAERHASTSSVSERPTTNPSVASPAAETGIEIEVSAPATTSTVVMTSQSGPDTEDNMPVSQEDPLVGAFRKACMIINPYIPMIDSTKKWFAYSQKLDDEALDDMQFLGEQFGALSRILSATREVI